MTPSGSSPPTVNSTCSTVGRQTRTGADQNSGRTSAYFVPSRNRVSPDAVTIVRSAGLRPAIHDDLDRKRVGRHVVDRDHEQVVPAELLHVLFADLVADPAPRRGTETVGPRSRSRQDRRDSRIDLTKSPRHDQQPSREPELRHPAESTSRSPRLGDGDLRREPHID